MKLLSICKRNKQCCRLIKWPVPLSSVPKRKGRRIKYGVPGIPILPSLISEVVRHFSQGHLLNFSIDANVDENPHSQVGQIPTEKSDGHRYFSVFKRSIIITYEAVY